MNESTTLPNAVIELTTDSFHAAANDCSGPLLVDFWAPWCGPCRQMAPILRQLAPMLAGVSRVAKVNIDESPDLAEAFGIRSIPTLVLMRGHEVLAVHSGLAPAHFLADWVKSKLGVGA